MVIVALDLNGLTGLDDWPSRSQRHKTARSLLFITSQTFHMILLLLLGVRSLHDQGRSGDEQCRLLQLLLAAVEFGRQGSADRPHISLVAL